MFFFSKACTDFNTMGCQLGVIRWWSKIAKVLYQTDEYIIDICHLMDESCLNKEWNCETCREDLRKVAQISNNPELVAKAIGQLKQQTWCKDDETCYEYLEAFLPAAIEYLSDHLKFNTIGLCSDIFNITCS